MKTFKVLLWQNGAKAKNGLAPIYARITIRGRRAEISTGRNCPVANWDSKTSRIVGRSEGARALNQELERIKHRLHECYKELLDQGTFVDARAVKSRYLGEDRKGRTLLEIVDYHGQKMEGVFKEGTLKNYRTTKTYLEGYLLKVLRTRDIYLEQLQYGFIIDFERYLRNSKNALSNKPLTNNGTMKHLERLNKLMNLAVDLEWSERNPFARYSLKFTKYDRSYLTEQELLDFATIKLQKPALSICRDMFVLACYTGLSYIDLKQLTVDRITIGIDGKKWFFLQREKSKQPVKVPLLAKALAILDKYGEDLRIRNSLPVYSNQKMNKYIREVTDLCGINKHISFHVARHTFATTVTLSNGVPIETVSKLLGHTKLSTTQIYARVLENKISSDMELLENRLILKEKNVV
nr:site-specific integrase [Flagellimonas sp. S3867]